MKLGIHNKIQKNREGKYWTGQQGDYVAGEGWNHLKSEQNGATN